MTSGERDLQLLAEGRRGLHCAVFLREDPWKGKGAHGFTLIHRVLL